MRLCPHCKTQIEDKNINYCPRCGKSLLVGNPPSHYLPAGTILQGKYILERPIGSGGFGITYAGWDYQLKRKVAIKEFFPRQYAVRYWDGCSVAVTREQQRPRFQNGIRSFLEEARNVAALQDIKGVVNIINYFEANNTAYIVMEYLEGLTLKDYLKDKGNRQDYEWCRQVILSVLYTLQEIHARGVLHRDIAPDNIFITRDGTIKLLDFGTAKHAFAMDDAKSELMLKVGYAPIEQYVRNSAQGPYTDLYAVAALFYRMLTGHTPPPADKRRENEHLVMPSQMGISLPKGAERAIKTCLEMYAMRRLQSAGEFIRLLNGESFVPVPGNAVDPESNIPEEKQQHNFPTWGKVFIACLLCGIILGCAALPVVIKNSNKDTATMIVSNYSLDDYTGDSVAQVQEKLDSTGNDISLKVIKKFNADPEVEGEVYEQVPRATSDLMGNLPDGWNTESGKIAGTLTCYVYTNEEITYGEVRDLNAYSLSKLLNWDMEKSGKFVGTDAEGAYFDIYKVEMSDGREIYSEEMKQEDADIVIETDKIEKIYYCASEFFYWEAIGNYVGKNISEVSAALYIKVDEDSAPKAVGEKMSLQGTNLVDENYYSFEEETGYIFEQTVAPGQMVNTGEGILEPIWHVVGEQLTYTGKTGDILTQELYERGFACIAYTGSKDGTQEVISVEVFDMDSGNPVREFGPEQNIEFMIETRKEPESQMSPDNGAQQPPAPQPSTPSYHSGDSGDYFTDYDFEFSDGCDFNAPF